MLRKAIIFLITLLITLSCHNDDSDLKDLTGLYELKLATINQENCEVEGLSYDLFPKYFQIYYSDNDVGIVVEDCDGEELVGLTCGGLRGTEIGTLPMREEIPGGWRDRLFYGFWEFGACNMYGDVTSVESVGGYQLRYTREQRGNVSNGSVIPIPIEMCSNVGAETLFNSGELSCFAYKVAYAELVQRTLIE